MRAFPGLRRTTWPVAAMLAAGCRGPAPGSLAPAGGDAVAASGGEVTRRLDPAQRRTIGVLPFRNRSGDAALDWLERAAADRIVGELGSSPGFIVHPPARTADLAGEDAAGDLPIAELAAAARARGFDALVAGRFRREGTSLVVEADLIDAAAGRALGSDRERGQGLDEVYTTVNRLARRLNERLGQGRASHPAAGQARAAVPVEALRHFTAARAHMDRLLYREAAEALERAVAVWPDYALAWYYLAKARHGLGESGAAGEALERARQARAQLSEIEELRVRLFAAQLDGDLDDLGRVSDELWRRAPQDIDSRFEVASMLQERFQDDRAREELELILEDDPERKLVYNQLGYLHAMRGDFATALRYLERYRELTPGEPNAHDSIGEVLAMSGRLEEAAEAFQLALARWPTFENSARRLTGIYADLGDAARALEQAERFAAIAPSRRVKTEAEVARAIVLWRFGRHGEAAAGLEAAERTDPDDPLPGALAAHHAEVQGDAEGARRRRDEWFVRLAGRLRSASAEPRRRAQLAVLGAVEGAAPREVLAWIDEQGEERHPRARDVLDALRAPLLLRLGEHAAARAWLEGPGGRAIERLVGSEPAERGPLIRLLFESVEREASEQADSRTLVRILESAADRSGRAELKVLTRLIDLQYAEKRPDRAAAQAGRAELGVPPEGAWRVLGPLPGTGGFHRVFGPERTGGRGLAAGEGEPSWRPSGDAVPDGWLDLAARLGPAPWAVGYAEIAVDSPGARAVQIRLASGGAVKLWVNGELVWQAYHIKGSPLDGDRVKVVLRQGENRILVKVLGERREWGFWLRVTDESGAGFTDLVFRPPGATRAARRAGAARQAG